MHPSTYLWTQLGARLQLVSSSEGKNLNWIFLPGGPGLGSEALAPLTSLLTLPGNMWHLDLPGDGSNRQGSIKNWKQALLEAVQSLQNVILVGHSRGGMFALATPELQHLLKGLVLLDAAPDRTWTTEFERRVKTLAKMKKHEAAYRKKPSNSSLKNFVLSGAPYMFAKKHLKQGIRCLKNLPYNYKAFQWAETHFDKTYQAKWIPKIPTLIVAGENDLATPLHLFQTKKFQRSNIFMKEIKHAGHFPWIENPAAVIAAFLAFITALETKPTRASFRKSGLRHHRDLG